jgi:serine protease Do
MNQSFTTRAFLYFIAAFFIIGIQANVYASSAGLPDFTTLVEKSAPAVVNISTTQKIRQSEPMSPHGGAPESPFDDFFKKFFGDQGGDIQEFDAKSLGSGFIISKDGYVLTNYHVIQDADEIIVRLSDKRELEAKVIGSDKRSDIALLKIDADGDLPVAKIGKSSNLKVGEWVLAIGSPFGFDHTVTAGIVSAKERSLPNENYVPFIQTDVAINPGNSGGPLYSMDGEVVGVNSQIYSRTGGFMGLSFAIPIDVVMNVVDQLKKNGQVTRGWLGILIQDVTRELAESFDMPKPIGALVARVLPDSPASDADIHVGDVIVQFDGKEVTSSSSLPPMVGITKVGDKVDVKIIRDGKTITKKVEIGELPQEEDLALSGGEEGNGVNIKRLEITVSNLTEDQKGKLEDDKSGVYVENVDTGPASTAGLRKGDIILMINNENVSDTKQFKGLVDDLPSDKSVPMLVQRRNGPIFLALKITED